MRGGAEPKHSHSRGRTGVVKSELCQQSHWDGDDTGRLTATLRGRYAYARATSTVERCAWTVASRSRP
jgi:hypothetical protein